MFYLEIGAEEAHRHAYAQALRLGKDDITLPESAMKINLLILLTCLVSTLLHCNANDDYENGIQPKLPVPFPTAYTQYQILPTSISPDKKYALIYPKRALLYELKDYGLYLVALNPFQVLAEVPMGYSNLAENAKDDYQVNWAANSSAVIMIEDVKWGPDKVILITINDGLPGKPTDLAAEAIKQINPFFKKANPRHFNDTFDYIFDDDFGESWDINDHSQVLINCAVTNDPNISIGKDTWTARFQAVWDISKGKFIRKKFKQKWGIISENGI